MHTQRATLAASLLGIAVLLASAAAPAAVIYNEAFQGDLSSTAQSPTPVGTLALGISTVSGRLVNNFENPADDGLDVFSFVVAAGTEVSALTLDFVQGPYPDGANIVLRPTAGGADLGALNIRGPGIVSGADLFQTAAFGFGGPLGSGDYSIELRGVGTRLGLNSYSLNFNLVDPNAQPVPEPTSALLVVGSLLALGATCARRRA